ncbi:general odorant-binding protein 56d-like [Phlebotomus argentipes]|uniref:general odorant-binding protein 56d-like n=1 Tax=Phlebotomus argentipes TaxID=94469 RepID=UPI002893715B|nr:general odorant-binding protein 56d-like [Phlebotomus argentipes]
MKIVSIALCLTVGLLPAVLCQNDQLPPPAILAVVVPCAQQTGQSFFDLEGIVKGNFTTVRHLYGCFADCVFKKVGFVSEDNAFHEDVLRTQLAKFVKAEQAQEYTERCSARIGTEECQVSGRVFSCLLFSFVGTMYA